MALKKFKSKQPLVYDSRAITEFTIYCKDREGNEVCKIDITKGHAQISPEIIKDPFGEREDPFGEIEVIRIYTYSDSDVTVTCLNPQQQ